MSDKTGIEWTDATWNPVRGCSRVSEGCRNCYAERVAARFSAQGQPYEGLAVMRNGEPRWTGKVRLVEEHLDDPLKWRKPRRVFVNSMSDLFHESLPAEAIDRVFAVMALAPRHAFQILTKRPAEMWAYVSDVGARWRVAGWASLDPARVSWPLPNVWLGVSTEDQRAADERIPLLLQTPAAVRFVSAEPLLGSIDFGDWISDPMTASSPDQYVPDRIQPLLHWIIVGGESGPGARPMHPAWARDIRDQCVAAGVAFFFKQWGEWAPIQYASAGDGRLLLNVSCNGRDESVVLAREGDPGTAVNLRRVGKKAAGRVLDGRTWDEFPGSRVLPEAVDTGDGNRTSRLDTHPKTRLTKTRFRHEGPEPHLERSEPRFRGSDLSTRQVDNSEGREK